TPQQEPNPMDHSTYQDRQAQPRQEQSKLRCGIPRCSQQDCGKVCVKVRDLIGAILCGVEQRLPI
ncbi:MAG: hypothetical protein QM373_06390, partial [Bacillota bacterium]|nr:hypothetical protein [Bacillota bacterium]